MKQWSTVKRYCVFVMGMVFCALGISFVTRAGLGTSPVSGLPFVLSLITEISMGTFTFLFNMLFLILEAVIRRKLGFLQLLQIPMTFCFSFFPVYFYIILYHRKERKPPLSSNYEIFRHLAEIPIA